MTLATFADSPSTLQQSRNACQSVLARTRLLDPRLFIEQILHRLHVISIHQRVTSSRIRRTLSAVHQTSLRLVWNLPEEAILKHPVVIGPNIADEGFAVYWRAGTIRLTFHAMDPGRDKAADLIARTRILVP